MRDDEVGGRSWEAGSDPRRVRDRADLVRELGLLRSRAALGSGRARVSLDRIAAATGVPRSTLHAYLRGERVPPPDILDAVVLALEASGAEAREWAEALYRVLATESARPATKARDHGETPARAHVVPRQLPAAVVLIGRDGELAALEAAAAPAEVSRVLAVTGSGGIGKSALVALWARRHAERFPDGQLWLDLRGFGLQPPMAPTEALERMLRALGADTSDLPQDADARAALFRTAATGRRLVIVLDNARDSEQVRDLLPGEPGCCTVVTSRSELRSLVAVHGARRLRLSRLDGAAGRAVLGAERVAAPREAVDRITQFCEGLPLALRIANERLSVLGPPGVDRYLAELEDTDRRLSALALPEISIRAVLRASYDALSAAEQHVFAHLPMLHSASVELAALAALCDTDEDVARAHCESLATANLLNRAGADTYRLHDLVAGFAAECLQTVDDAAAAAARHRLLLCYGARAHCALIAAERLHPDIPALPVQAPAVSGFATAKDAVAWVADALPAIAAACLVELDETDPAIVWTLLPTVFWTLLYRHDISIMTPATNAAVARAEADQRLRDEATLRNVLGVIASRSGQWDVSEREFDSVLRFRRAVGDVSGQVSALHNLSIIAVQSGHARRGIEFSEAAIALSKDAEVHCPPWSTYSNLANCQRECGDLDSASDAARRAMDAARSAADPAAIGLASHVLSWVDYTRGDLPAALAASTEAIQRSEECADRELLVGALALSAAVLCAQGDLVSANSRMRMADELNAGRLQQESVDVAMAQGLIALAMGRRSAGVSHFRVAVSRASGIKRPFFEADALVHLAVALAESGDVSSALEAARDALQICRSRYVLSTNTARSRERRGSWWPSCRKPRRSCRHRDGTVHRGHRPRRRVSLSR